MSHTVVCASFRSSDFVLLPDEGGNNWDELAYSPTTGAYYPIKPRTLCTPSGAAAASSWSQLCRELWATSSSVADNSASEWELVDAEE